jgi:glucose/arabinose dehydrogenase
VLPNNDVLVAQANTERFSGVEPAALEALKKAGNMGPSPNRITLLRDGDGDARFETREVFLSGLNQPFGMLLLRDHLYVANTDSVMPVPLHEGRSTHHGPGTEGRRPPGRRIQQPLDPQHRC